MRRKSHRRSRGGFTLVEMLVVLGILVLLASLVVPRVIGSQKKADLQSIRTIKAKLLQVIASIPDTTKICQ